MSIQRSSGSRAAGDEVPDGYDAAEACTSGVQRVASPYKQEENSAAPPRSRAGWTVLEEYESEGYCYQVLRRPVAVDGPRLTKREEEVVARACQGESNKSIAIELSLSPSTVGVLLFRAAAKLGAQSRHQLLTLYANSTLRKR